MRVLALLLCGLAVALATQEEWEAWKAEYGRDYGNDLEEEAYRQSVFEANMDLINAHNADFDNGLVLFTLGMNQFGDMTTEEIKSYMLGFVPEDDSTKTENTHEVLSTSADDPPLPTALDWRSKANGSVTAVKDQGHCGSCWAFSATGSLEGQHFLKTNKTVSLSEQNLVDCDKIDHGCFGGLQENAYKYIKTNNGIDTEASYPYTAKDGKCNFTADHVGSTVTGYVFVKQGDEAALQKAVATVGPIAVAIDAHLPTFHFYKKGIYHDRKCSSVHLDHGVLVVGYNSTAPADDVNGHKSHDFWIVKNSWNTSWGDKGYINMARNKHNACGISTHALYPLV